MVRFLESEWGSMKQGNGTLRRAFSIAILLPLAAHCAIGSADTDPNAAAKLQLQQQKELIDAQKALLDSQAGLLTSQKSMIDAMFPRFTGGKAGEITSGSSVDAFHANINAYRALQSAAMKLCAVKQLADAPQAMLVSDEDLRSVVAYRIIDNQLRELMLAYKAIEDEDTRPNPKRTMNSKTLGTLPLYAAEMALSSLADFTRLFRTDLKVSAEAVQLSDADLTTALLGCPGPKDGQAGKVFSSSTDLFQAVLSPGTSAFWTSFQTAQSERAIAEARAATEDAELSLLDKGKLTASEKKTYVELQASVSRVKALLAAHDKLELAITGVDETTKEPNLVKLFRGEALQRRFTTVSATGGVLLSATVAVKGGFSVVSQSIWRPDRFYSLGGLVISFRVLDGAGQRVVATGFLVEESPGQEVKFGP